jgi:hypothetical protein
MIIVAFLLKPSSIFLLRFLLALRGINVRSKLGEERNEKKPPVRPGG